MPEMFQLCGRRFQVYKSAHKTCDTVFFPFAVAVSIKPCTSIPDATAPRMAVARPGV